MNGASAANGSDTVLDGGASGSTRGLLTLHQTVTGGGGGGRFGDGSGGVGGDATVSIAGVNPGGGALHLISEAIGGGGDDSPVNVGTGDATRGGRGIVGSVIGSSSTGAAVTVEAHATGGTGGNAFGPTHAGDGGDTQMGPVFGSSAVGGSVSVFASSTGGEGGQVSDFGSGASGSGASSALVNAVDGSTSGSLLLSQDAVGGTAGFAGTGALGQAGSASSTLTKDTANASLAVFSAAFGGGGAPRNASTGVSGDGAQATASGSSTNRVGTSLTVVTAGGGTGGSGFSGGADGGAGGSATVFASGETFSDGAGVTVGTAPSAARPGFSTTPVGGAFGGDGGGASSSNPSSHAGRGGDASSDSQGVAHGNSTVTVFDFAQGGTGGPRPFSFPPGGPPFPPQPGVGNAGGNTFSTAMGSGGGVSDVNVTATALGGDGGYLQTGGTGGNAVANASGSGLGLVNVHAVANGGLGRFRGLGGTGLATAIASGLSGTIAADAGSNGGLITSVTAHADSATPNGGTVQTAAAVGQSLTQYTSTPLASFARVGALPLASDVNSALAGHANVSGALDPSGLGTTLALISMGGGSLPTAPSGSMTEHSEIDLSLHLAGSNLQDELVVGFLDGKESSGGFSGLRLRVMTQGQTVFDTSFSDPASALTFLNDRVVGLGGWQSSSVGDVKVSFLFDVTTTNPGDGFESDLAFGTSAVPEPSTVLLLATGVLSLAATRYRKKPTERQGPTCS
jgi:hypothetical protein